MLWALKDITLEATWCYPVQCWPRIIRMVEAGIFPVEKIVVEITETGLIHELSRTLDVLTRLRMKRIQLSIDDFGTGYAMMRQLQNVPATELKIDKSLIENLHANESDRVMVEKIIEMGHELHLEVMAEGVKTREQLILLREMGCDGAQGFLFSPPLSATELVDWLAAYPLRKV